MIQLSDIVAAAKLQQEWEQEVERLEGLLTSAKEKARNLQVEIVPNMMIELGITSFELDNGYKVSIKDEYYAKIPEDKYYETFQWLHKNNLDGIVKTQVQANFGKGEIDEAQKVVDWLTANGIPASVKSSVHPQTLKAFVKERITHGYELPMDLFGASVVKTTVISK